MNVADLQFLYEYNCWANGRILDSAALVEPGQFAEHVEHSHGSLRGTLVHTLDAEESWRTRIMEGHSTPDLVEAEFPDVPAIRARWQTEQDTMVAYLATLNDAQLGQTVHYTVGEQDYPRVLWHCIVHMVDHGTQHRSEAAAILTSFGRSPGDVHLMRWVRENKVN